jgi:hypothetical protein
MTKLVIPKWNHIQCSWSYVLQKRTEESARRVVAYFENQLEVNKAIGDADGIATAKSNIAVHSQSMKMTIIMSSW